jgi:hypothetical protein
VLACSDRAFLAQVGGTLRAAGLDVRPTTDATVLRPVDHPLPTCRTRRSRAA